MADGVPQMRPIPCGGLPPPEEEVFVSNRVLHQLFVYDGYQRQVVRAYVNRQVRHPPLVTAWNVVKHVLGDWRRVRIVADDDHPNVFFIWLPTPEDVDRFHGTRWYWWEEHMTFRRVMKVTETPELTDKSRGDGIPQQWF